MLLEEFASVAGELACCMCIVLCAVALHDACALCDDSIIFVQDMAICRTPIFHSAGIRFARALTAVLKALCINTLSSKHAFQL